MEIFYNICVEEFHGNFSSQIQETSLALGKGHKIKMNYKDDKISAILEAASYEAAGDSAGMFQAIRRGLEYAYDNYELYYMLGHYYLQENIDQAYLCFQNALLYCDDEADRDVILADMEKLEETESVSVRNTAIVIVSYNSCYLMQKNIESIRQTLLPETYQIVVVDNASDDGVAQWLQEQNDVLLLLNNQNVGFSPACNQAVRALSETDCADYDIFLLNNDTRLAPNSLFWLRMGLYEKEEIGATGSCSNYAGNDQQIDIEFSLPTEYLQYGAKLNIPSFNPYEERVRLSGFAMLIKRYVWDAVGGMDEDFAPGYFEDDDLSMKILRIGYRLLLCKNSFIYHAGSQSFSQYSNLNELLYKHYYLFIQKYRFDILKYAAPDTDTIAKIPFDIKGEFNLLQIGSGLGADLKYIRTMFPNAHAIGIENDPTLFELSQKTDVVSPNLNTLAEVIEMPVFQVLMSCPEEYDKLSASDKEILGRICRPDCIVLQKHHPEITFISDLIG